jgi:hypothetical protein
MPQPPAAALRRRRNVGDVLPGALSWGLILLMLVGMLAFPRAWLVIATVLFGLFLVRSLVYAVYAVLGQLQVRRWERLDWTLAAENPAGPDRIAASDVYHVVIIPNFNEPEPILRRTLDALAKQHRAAERLIVVLGMEQREVGSREKGERIAGAYRGRFLATLVTVHPYGIAGEAAGKASNENWAARLAWREVARLGIDPDHATITSCDADSLLHPAYFSAVAKLFAENPRRHRTFWQAPILYYNNIWSVPTPIRVNTWLSHAMQIAELAMPFYHPLPISTYTLSLTLAEQCGWWDPTVISEDWHEYLSCMFATGERIGTESVFLPTTADATDGDGLAGAMSNRFVQVQRHAWGAEDVGYILSEIAEHPGSLRRWTLGRFLQVLGDHVGRVASWCLLLSISILTAHYSRFRWYDEGFRDFTAHNLSILRVLFGVAARSS